MTKQEREELLHKAKDFFREEIVSSHIDGALDRASELESYNIHPFLLKYLANFLEGNDKPESIAKALIYPRILGTSITTIFGNKVQKMVGHLFSGLGSTALGIDIEFIDAIDGRKKYCQLKSGPNTINKDDIVTVINHFSSIRHLARTNNLSVGIDDLIVGVLYGSEKNLSNHYKKISKTHPVFVGANFWHRLTGQPDFYEHLISAIGEVAIEVDGREKLESAIIKLAHDLEENFKL